MKEKTIFGFRWWKREVLDEQMGAGEEATTGPTKPPEIFLRSGKLRYTSPAQSR